LRSRAAADEYRSDQARFRLPDFPGTVCLIA
jgi:hypothetical protein